MKKFSFENQGEMRAYDRGKQDAIEELFAGIYEDLAADQAFPDTNPKGFAEWGRRWLLPRIGKRRGGDDLFGKLMNMDVDV